MLRCYSQGTHGMLTRRLNRNAFPHQRHYFLQDACIRKVPQTGPAVNCKAQPDSVKAPELTARPSETETSTSGRRQVSRVQGHLRFPAFSSPVMLVCYSYLTLQDEEQNLSSGGGRDIPYGIIAVAAALGAAITGYLALVWHCLNWLTSLGKACQ